MIEFVVLDHPISVEGIDTGDKTMRVSEAIDMYNIQIHKANEDHKAHIEDQIEALIEAHEAHEDHEDLKAHEAHEELYSDKLKNVDVIHFVQNGLDINVPEPCFSYGTGLEFHPIGYKFREAEICNLSPFGILSGSVSAIALNSSYKNNKILPLTYESFNNLINTKTVIVHLNDKLWYEGSINTSNVLVNAIYIIHVPYDTFDEKLINDTNVSGISTMAGPLSVIFIALKNGDLYWYRGYGHPSIKFGTNVTEMFSEGDFIFKSNIYIKNSNIFLFNKKLMLFDNIFDILYQMTYEDIVDNVIEIENLISQMQVIFDPIKLKSVIDKIVEHLLKIQKESLLKQSSIIGNMSIEELKSFFKSDVARKHNKMISRLVNKLGESISLVGTANRTFNLKNMQRKAQISDNVTKAKTLSLDQKFDILSKYCDEDIGVLFSRLNSDEIIPALEPCKSDDYRQSYLSLANINPRIPYLDIDTSQSMLEIAPSNEDHELYAKNGITIRLSSTDHDIYIPFPMIKSIIDCKDPSAVFWVEECNKEEWAMFRIMIRNSLAESHANRTFSVKASSKSLGFLIINIILSTMESLCKSIAIPEFNDTTAKIMRGLFGQLFTLCASGAHCLSDAWQLVMKDSKLEVPPINELWVYVRTYRMFIYTGWNMDIIKNNMKVLFVKIIKNNICNKAIESLRKNSSLTKYAEYEKFERSRMLELYYSEIMINLIMKFEINNAMAYRFLEIYNVDVGNIINSTASTKSFEEYFRKISMKEPISDSYKFQILKNAVDIYVKRSAHFKDSKQNIKDVISKKDEPIKKEEYSLALKKLIEEIPDIVKKHGSKMQNYDPYLNLAEGKDIQKQIGKIKGDAELKRIPFSITNERNKDIQSVIDYIVTGFKDSKPSEALKALNASEAPISFISQIEKYKGNETAIMLYNEYDNPEKAIQLIDSKSSDILEMLNALEISQNKGELIKNIIKSLLLNFKLADNDKIATKLF